MSPDQPADHTSPLSTTNSGGLRLQCKIVPRASRLRFGPVIGARLKIQLPAPPVDHARITALVRAWCAG